MEIPVIAIKRTSIQQRGCGKPPTKLPAARRMTSASSREQKASSSVAGKKAFRSSATGRPVRMDAPNHRGPERPRSGQTAHTGIVQPQLLADVGTSLSLEAVAGQQTGRIAGDQVVK